MIRTELASLSIAEVRCAPSGAEATKMTCSLSPQAGEPVEVVVVMGESGWKFEQPTKVLARATLAESLTNDLQEKAKKAVVVDCGTGIFGYSAGDTLTCTAARKGAKKLGSMTVNFTDGGYKWQAEGI